MEAGVENAAGLLVAACEEHRADVPDLLSALERDVYQAADRCWKLADRPVQLKGGLLRSKTVVLQEPTFHPDIEQAELGGALEQWRDAVKSVVASAALRVRMAEQQLVAAVGRLLLEQEPPASADQLAGALSALLSAHGAVHSLSQRDLRATTGLLCQLAAQVALAWRQAGGADPLDLLAAHPGAPPEILAALTAPVPAAAAAAGEGGGQPVLPPEQAASLAALKAREESLLEELSEAGGLLRFWGRRSEKAAAGAPAGGREGDVPPLMAQAQQLLWAAANAYEEEQAAADTRTRALVCQRYRPPDLAALQQRADEYAGGERVPAQPNLMFEPEFVELRGQARALAGRFVQEKGVGEAAQQLHQLRYLMLEADLPPESAPARQQLLLRVAASLLDGSTPPAAAPLLVAMLQEGLKRAEEGGGQAEGEEPAVLSEAERARLVPMVCRGLVAATPVRAGGRPVLRQQDASALLRSLLRPEAMLDQGRLGAFADTLKAVLDTCASAGVPADGTEALLSLFDASRLAVLVCEQAAKSEGDTDTPTAAGGGGQGSTASVQQLLPLAHAALVQPGAEATGLALLEGLLLLQPAAYLAAALQLALGCGSAPAQQRVISMLCRVPADMLPPAVVGDALVQLAEALDGGTLSPPFLPLDFMGRLYRTPCVLASLRLSVERGAEAAAAAAAADASAAGPPGASSQGLWTVRIGASPDSVVGESKPAGQEHEASGSSSALQQQQEAEPGAEGAAEGEQKAAGGAVAAAKSQALLLLPLQPSSQPLAVLWQRLVGAVLSCLLRRAGGALDATSLSEELSALLELLLMPAAEQGAWLLQWLWEGLYQECLRDFLRDLSAVDPAASQLATAAFNTYWSSLPWKLATFHATSPAALATLRLHLVSPPADGAAAALLQKLDFAPVLAKAAPAPKLAPKVDQVYSLTDEEGEEEEQAGAGGPGGSAAWSAELGLLALSACVVVPAREQPAWLLQLLRGAPWRQGRRSPEDPGGEEEADVAALMRSGMSATLAQLAAAAGDHQPLLPHLLATADWRRVAAVVHAEQEAAGGEVPWLLLPALLAPGSMPADLGDRLVEAATLLSRAAAVSGSQQAAELAAPVASSLLLCSLCQGGKHRQRPTAAQTEEAAIAAAIAASLGEAPPAEGPLPGQEQAQHAQQERLVIPEDFPRELLEDTVEGQQLLLMQQQEEERKAVEARRQAAAAESGGAAAEGAPQQAQQAQQRPQEIVEVRACWNLTADQHLALLQRALLPLADAFSAGAAAAGGSWHPELCPPELASPPASAGALFEWRAPHLAELLQASSVAAASVASAPAAPSTRECAAPGAAWVSAAAGLLVPLVRPALTVLQQEGLPFANSELPLDTEGAVYVSMADRPAAGVDAPIVRTQLVLAVQAACRQPGREPLATCLLRLLYGCPALRAGETAMQLSEGLLRGLVAPDQEGGPLGRGALAAAAGGGAAGGNAEASIPVSTVSGSALPAVTATQGLPAADLLDLAHSASQQHAPLTAALSLERLRAGATVLPKEDWQAQAAQVLQAALQAEAGPTHPFDVVSVWLAALAWVADARWRRLASSGPHQAALVAWLEALELRVVALRLAQPDDFSLETEESTARRLLHGAAHRLKSVRQHIPGLGQPSDRAHSSDSPMTDEQLAAALQASEDAAWADSPATGGAAAAGGGSPGKERELGQRLTTGFKNLLSKAGGKPPGSAGDAEGDAGGSSRSKFGDKLRTRLAKMGLGGKGEHAPNAEPVSFDGSPLPPPTVTTLPVSQPYGGPGAGLTPVAEENASFTSEGSALLGPDMGHLGTGPAAAGPGYGAPPSSAAGSSSQAGGSGAGGAVAVRQKLSQSLQAMGRGLSGGVSKLKDRLGGDQPGGPSADELAEQDRDVACRIGLAAFAVSAYIKSVLCPALTTRLSGVDSAGPGTPTAAAGAAAGPGGMALPAGSVSAAQRQYHRTRSSFGSLQLDQEYMRELDKVLEARSELDTLDTLAACPLLAAHPGRYHAFFTEVPALLTAATAVEAFQRRLQQLLFPAEPQLVALA